MPSITQSMLDIIANQSQYNSNQVNGMANVIAKYFGVAGLKDLPKGMQDVIKQGMYVLSNNYGDKMGILNQGNLFANMHQAILSGGPMRSSGLGGNLISSASGAGARSVQMADIMTKVAGDYFATKDGAERISNTHGMSSQLFEGYAAGVMRERGINDDDIKTVVSKGRGAESLRKTLAEAKKNGVDTNSQQYETMVDIYRVTREREKKMKSMSQYKELQEEEKKLKKFESMDQKKMTSEEREEARKTAKRVHEIRSSLDRQVDKALEGTELEEETIDGKRVGKKKISSADLTAARQQQWKGGTQAEMITKDAVKDVHEALRAGSKNIAELEKMFGTSEFSELQNMAKQLGMGSLTDKQNVDKVTRSIKQAQVLAEKTGRSIQSIMNEQGSLASAYSRIYGGEYRVDNKAVARTQRISEEAGAASAEAGIGGTKEEVAAGQVASDAAAMEETKNISALKYTLHSDKAVSLSKEAKESGADLEARIDEALNSGDYEAIAALDAEAGQWVSTYGDMNAYKQLNANKEFGSDIAGKYQMSRVLSNVQEDMGNLTQEQIQGMAQNGTDITSEKTQGQILSALKNVSNSTLNRINKAAEKSPEAMEKEINSILEEAKGTMSEEDYAEFEKSVRGIQEMGAGGRKYLTSKAYDKDNEGRETLESKMKNETAISKKILDDTLAEGEEVQKTGVQSAIAGALAGDKAITNRDAALQYMVDKGYVGENGFVGQKEIEKMNKEDSGMFALQLDTETGAIKNTDALDKEITLPDGSKVPLWKAMGLGETKEEALKNAKDTNKVAQGMQELSKQGISSAGLGNGNVAFFDQKSMDERTDMMEEQRQLQKESRKRINAYNTNGERISDAEFDENGKLKSATVDGKKYEGRELEKKLKDVASKDTKIQNALAGLDNEYGEAARKTQAHDQFVNSLVGGAGLTGDEELTDDDFSEDKWDDLSEEEKASYGGRSNYKYQLAIRQKLQESYKNLKGDAKKKFDEYAVDYLKRTTARKPGESDEDFEDRIKEKVDDKELTAREYANIMSEHRKEIGSLEGGKKASDDYGVVAKAERGDFLNEKGPQKFWVNGHNQTINMDDVRRDLGMGGGPGGPGGPGGGVDMSGLENLLQPLAAVINSLGGCVNGQALRVTETSA